MITNWIDDNLNDINSADYWNDAKKEEKKIFNISNGDIKKLETNKNLNSIFNHLQQILKDHNIDLNGKNILSLAAGTCWLEARTLNNIKFKKFTAVDFSKHRIHDLALKTFESYNCPVKNVDFVHGNILDLKLKNNSQDIIILSQAFHHTTSPIELLNEMIRVLKPEGKIIILGEHFFNTSTILYRSIKHIIKWILNHKQYRKIHMFLPQYRALFPPCPIKGDYHYSKSEYFYFFHNANLEFVHSIATDKTTQGFLIELSGK